MLMTKPRKASPGWGDPLQQSGRKEKTGTSETPSARERCGSLQWLHARSGRHNRHSFGHGRSGLWPPPPQWQARVHSTLPNRWHLNDPSLKNKHLCFEATQDYVTLQPLAEAAGHPPSKTSLAPPCHPTTVSPSSKNRHYQHLSKHSESGPSPAFPWGYLTQPQVLTPFQVLSLHCSPGSRCSGNPYMPHRLGRRKPTVHTARTKHSQSADADRQ